MKLYNILKVFILSILLLVLTGCSNLKYEISRDRTIISPDKTYSLTLRYDYVSRPSIFKDNKLIYKYDGSGFTESVEWNIEWIDDNKILLYIKSPQRDKYNNERYYIYIK